MSFEEVKEIKEVLHQQVHSSALEIVSGRPILSNHHEVYVQSICAALVGSEWHRSSRDEQQAKKNAIQEEYERMLACYLPVLQKFQHDTNNILKSSEAFVASFLGKTTHTLDKPIDKGKVGESRDQAARKRLGSRYWTYEQYRGDLVQRREEAPDAQCEPANFHGVPLNEDNKTKTCPVCEKRVHNGSISRHFRQVHILDPRSAIFCPRCPRSGPVWVSWRGDSSAINIHLQFTHKTVFNKKGGKADKNTGKDKNQITQTAFAEHEKQEAEYYVQAGYAEKDEQAERVQWNDQFPGTDEDAIFDGEILDDRVCTQDMDGWVF